MLLEKEDKHIVSNVLISHVLNSKDLPKRWLKYGQNFQLKPKAFKKNVGEVKFFKVL